MENSQEKEATLSDKQTLVAENSRANNTWSHNDKNLKAVGKLVEALWTKKQDLRQPTMKNKTPTWEHKNQQNKTTQNLQAKQHKETHQRHEAKDISKH